METYKDNCLEAMESSRDSSLPPPPYVKWAPRDGTSADAAAVKGEDSRWECARKELPRQRSQDLMPRLATELRRCRRWCVLLILQVQRVVEERVRERARVNATTPAAPVLAAGASSTPAVPATPAAPGAPTPAHEAEIARLRAGIGAILRQQADLERHNADVLRYNTDLVRQNNALLVELAGLPPLAVLARPEAPAPASPASASPVSVVVAPASPAPASLSVVVAPASPAPASPSVVVAPASPAPSPPDGS